MKSFIYIFLAGGIGSILRYLLSFYTQKLWNFKSFPIGTLLVNLLGCFLIGFLISYNHRQNNDFKFLLIIGFCGGFTTFSTFSWENYTLFKNQYFITLFLNIFLSIFLGIFFVFLGDYFYKKIFNQINF